MKKDDDEITFEQAVDLLPDKEIIHTYVNPTVGMLIGAEWTRDEVITKLKDAKGIVLSGDHARAMKHGIAVYDSDDDVFFVETNMKKLEALDPQQ